MRNNKVVLIMDRRWNDLRIVVNGEVSVFVWDVTGVVGRAIMRRGEVAGTLPHYDKIKERW